MKAKKLETKYILINGRNYKGLVIWFFFTRYDHNQSIKILNLYYDGEHEGKNIW